MSRTDSYKCFFCDDKDRAIAKLGRELSEAKAMINTANKCLRAYRAEIEEQAAQLAAMRASRDVVG